MRPIPPKLREEIASDPFMRMCIYRDINAPNHDCKGGITWEHAWIIAGRQVNEAWAIVPCCWNHNVGSAIVKSYNQYRALIRADIEDLKKRYPKRNWDQELKYLKSLYEKS